MKQISTLLFALLSSSVFAVGIGNDNPPGGSSTVTNTNLNANSNTNRIDNNVRANASAWQAQNQMQAQAQFQTANSNSNSNSNSSASTGPVTVGGQATTVGGQSTTVGGQTTSLSSGAQVATLAVNYPQDRLQAPGFALGNVYPTAPCMGSSQVGGSGVGFSFGVGTSWKDDECGIRETSRSFATLGLKDDAIKVLCTSQYAAAATVCATKETK